eukprot:6203305-Pleurochrysis_carterae.AAC.1
MRIVYESSRTHFLSHARKHARMHARRAHARTQPQDARVRARAQLCTSLHMRTDAHAHVVRAQQQTVTRSSARALVMSGATTVAPASERARSLLKEATATRTSPSKSLNPLPSLLLRR